jgi:predicted nucleic acid-binding Zn ribbon protein
MSAKADLLMPVGCDQTQVVEPFIRHIAHQEPYGWCPECNSIIYTRRHRLCGVCGEELPEELLFSVMEASRVKELLRNEQHRHRVWMARREDT